jgi:hypothetical protein
MTDSSGFGRRASGLCALLLIAGACADPSEQRLAPSTLWGVAPEQNDVQEPVDFRDRASSPPYGLPAPGQPGLGDLVALMPTTGVARTDPNLFAAADVVFSTDQCQGGGPVLVDELPMTIEAVVGLHPRHYIKPTVCGQDERNYGSYVLVDDTGGIVVLRDARTTPFTFGDRVRVTVHALMQGFGDPASRYVVLADVEKLPTPTDADGLPDRPVLFARHTAEDGPFTIDEVGQVKRIEGYVAVAPSNDNFNDMIVTSRPLPPLADRATADGVCLELCASACRSTCPSTDDQVCREAICPSLCQGEGTRIDAADLPTCWATGIDAELGRRGFGPDRDTRVAVTGPVVRGFQRQEIWVIRLGQVELLAAPTDE